MVVVNKTNIVLIGGSGDWSDRNHCRAISELSSRDFSSIRVGAICDFTEPQTRPHHQFLQQILNDHQPIWIRANKLITETLAALTAYHQKYPIDVIIIACSPCHHYDYCEWAGKLGIAVICDKPMVVRQNASSDYHQAKQIWSDFLSLQALFAACPRNFVVPLGRRQARAHAMTEQAIKEIYELSGQGITHLAFMFNYGIHRFAIEFLNNSAAHGYLDGVGSACHTFYHNLDLAIWHLQTAPGAVAYLQISVPYTLRAGDYIAQQVLKPLERFAKSSKPLPQIELAEIPDPILQSEFDFMVHITLLNKNKQKIGLMQLANFSSGMNTRLLGFDEKIIDPAAHPLGGRMKQESYDIHQSFMQRVLVSRMGEVFGRSQTQVLRSIHPMFGLSHVHFHEDIDDNQYPTSEHYRTIVKNQLLHLSGQALSPEQESCFSDLRNQTLTFKVFSVIYELLAYEISGKDFPNLAPPESIISII